jgi:hypothetical protein
MSSGTSFAEGCALNHHHNGTAKVDNEILENHMCPVESRITIPEQLSHPVVLRTEKLLALSTEVAQNQYAAGEQIHPPVAFASLQRLPSHQKRSNFPEGRFARHGERNPRGGVLLGCISSFIGLL